MFKKIEYRSGYEASPGHRWMYISGCYPEGVSVNKVEKEFMDLIRTSFGQKFGYAANPDYYCLVMLSGAWMVKREQIVPKLYPARFTELGEEDGRLKTVVYIDATFAIVPIEELSAREGEESAE